MKIKITRMGAKSLAITGLGAGFLIAIAVLGTLGLWGYAAAGFGIAVFFFILGAEYGSGLWRPVAEEAVAAIREINEGIAKLRKRGDQ